MANSLLKQIQPTVVKYANIISNVINVEVEIVDSSLIRIAGTGIYRDKINENMSKEGFIYRHVLKTGKHQIIENPGDHRWCKECPHHHDCLEKMQVSTPIKLNNEIIGVIGLICSDYKQKEHLLKNITAYLQFLYQISDFISTKVYEHLESQRNSSMIKLFKQIIDSVDKGVIVINHKSQIVDMNNSAMKQLTLTPADMNSNITIATNNEYIMGGEVFNVIIKNKQYSLIGQLIPVFPLLSSYDRIFIFNQIKKLKSDVYKLTNSHQSIKVGDMIGESQCMVQLKNKIRKIAASKSTVFITGESGTGKELIARAIHSESDRWNKPFIAINCGAIPDTLLESELFGYVRGAFSGASPNGKIGKFELANKGVIFLDEIGDMPLYLQVKILRVLQERKLVRIGSNQLIDLDIRVIAATNKDIKKLIKENKFREDLYYRLNVIPIDAPPLRDRKGDIDLIIDKMIEKYNHVFNKYVYTIEDETKRILNNYPWPGNIRELENTIEFMINLADDRGVLSKDMLPKSILEYNDKALMQNGGLDRIRPLKDIEREYIKKALDIYGHDTKGKQMASKKLGIGIATLYRKLGEQQ